MRYFKNNIFQNLVLQMEERVQHARNTEHIEKYQERNNRRRRKSCEKNISDRDISNIRDIDEMENIRIAVGAKFSDQL